ncbi:MULTISPECIES: hypothetical protein [Streptomyces]|uniref:Uncharacterized protein n=2 Tax=Streptomyces rimosus subsp. rimosus TaxID=132474 RepID=L8EUS6_STRR1|nr:MULTISPECIES: hypothetical protein [Streptomyces]KOG71898.1 hypothetical protein ADK78_22565 [Kitasatospora aureofaciens]MYT48637.1 hypothetical protein [Streptomyces sp. SID5471]KEF06089.1 hypothetical protein DF17_16250 [Streptomyces rimosus]KOT26719.1 hypothetical protein ADK84_39995 [Streptomyces sp. NRRL WC-3701]KOT45183.1 hypothetical protein ADK42_03060 [Streptomyces rimosus subsp. rimosus]
MSTDIGLAPPRGITGFPLGAAAGAVERTAAEWGCRVKVQDEGAADPVRYMKVTALHEQFEIVFHCEDGRTLTAAEVWIPRPGPEEITVRFRGVDVFRTPARRLLDHLREMSSTVLDETLYAYVPHLSLGFTRVAGHGVPLDSDGEPLYFQAVLTGPAGYYDFMVAEG